jgi:SAM-dependent methyltransferase
LSVRDAWEADFDARARAYWTPERTRKLTAGKKLLLLPHEAGPLLRALSLLNRDASMSADSVRKFMQINHMVALLAPAMEQLIRAHKVVRVLDAGCGSSYLTSLLAWCFARVWRHPAQILGVDRNAQVIAKCRERASLTPELADVLRYEATRLEELEPSRAWAAAWAGEEDPQLRPHAVIALHACDTATDHALALGVRLGADFIAAAPCCQAELARGFAQLAAAHAKGPMAPIWHSPHLRRDAGATLTDALRTLLLRGAGYEVTAMEFVPSTHTPKNTLLRAERRGRYWQPAFLEYAALRAAIGGVGITLEGLLPDEHRERLARATAG